MKKNDYPRVEVDWIDSAFHRGWSTLETKQKEMNVAQCRTVGFLIHRDRDKLCISSHLADDNVDAADALAIPAVAVRRVRILK